MTNELTQVEIRNGHLYSLLAELLEQLDYERVCVENGWDPRPLSWRHTDVEKRARDEIAETVTWWEHQAPERPHRMVGSTDSTVVTRRWAHHPPKLAP